MVKVRKDLTGKHIDGTYLTVLRQDEDIVRPSGKHIACYLVQCDCGSEPFRIEAGSIGRTKSCGCLIAKVQTERCKEMGLQNRIHNDTGSRLYMIWANMKERCYNKNNPKYKNYGDRGIIVCDEWKYSYVCFREWALSNGYSNLLTIDRIDVDGNYEPSNCRWTTNVEQSNNRTNNIDIEYKGEMHTLSEWSKILNINYHTLYRRLFVSNLSVDDAFNNTF